MTEDQLLTLGSVWKTKDEMAVVVVVGIDDDNHAVVADGWVSYGVRGTVSYDSHESFRREYPVMIFRAKRDV